MCGPPAVGLTHLRCNFMSMTHRSRSLPPHVFIDGDATLTRVAAFANDTAEAQLVALTRLRALSSTRTSELIGVLAVGYAVLFGGMGLWIAQGLAKDSLTLSIGLGAFLGIDPATWGGVKTILYTLLWGGTSTLVIFLFAAQVQRTHRAAVLLAAYTDELNRRYLALGRAANRWRKEHPIDWTTKHSSTTELPGFDRRD